jgi:hypothetical protein
LAASDRHLCGPRSQRGEASHQIRTGRQPQHRQGVRS